jgi:hypothetical protein
MDNVVMGLTLMAAADTSNFLSAACPSFMTARTFSSAGSQAMKDGSARDLRIGMCAASALSLAMATGATLVTKSWWPLAATVAFMLPQMGLIEYAIRNPRPYAKSMAAQ